MFNISKTSIKHVYQIIFIVCKLYLLRMNLLSNTTDFDTLYKTSFDPYLGIGLIGAIVLICFIPALVLIITLLASSVATEDLRPIMKDRAQNPQFFSDLLWIRTQDNKIFIYDQYDSAGSIPIQMFRSYPGRATLNIDEMIHSGVIIDSLYVGHLTTINPTVHPTFHRGNCVITSRLLPLWIDARNRAAIRHK